MRPGTPDIIKCPSCGAYQKRGTIQSGNTFGAEFYSDGSMVAPMLPELPDFTKCPECSVFYKIDAQTILSGNASMGFARLLLGDFENTADYLDALRKIPFVERLSFDDYIQVINIGLFNGDDNDILALRILFWRASNERIRKGRNQNYPIGEDIEKIVYEENCRKILMLMQENSYIEKSLMRDDYYYSLKGLPDISLLEKHSKLLERIMQPKKFEQYFSTILSALKMANSRGDEKPLLDVLKEMTPKAVKESRDENCLLCAELCRNIGEFDKCKSLLEEIEQTDKYADYISSITFACDERNSNTISITRNEPKG